MTTLQIDVATLRGAVDLLEQVDPDARLSALENLAINNGTWSVPEDPRGYHPVIFEIQILGVPALSDTAEQLPANWLKAARNILNAAATEAAA